MTVRLSVKQAVWRAHVADVVTRTDGLVPVVKGNGYGFGRLRLAAIAAEFCDTVAVGTVHELGGLPSELDVVVLTPTLAAPSSAEPILTVGSTDHVAALAGWSGRVIVKLRSAMQRYGGSPALVEASTDAGLDVVGVAVHPPLVGTAEERVAQVTEALGPVPPSIPAWVSHVELGEYARLAASDPAREFRLRLGTALWHGDKRALQLDADVLDVKAIAAGDRAGYRLGRVPVDGHLVMIGAGTANGVTPLPDGRSPFHHARTRLALHEPPHMHTSMAFVPGGDPVPAVGDWVDVQRPLHMTTVDEYRWL